MKNEDVIWQQLLSLASSISHREWAYTLRRRMNPQHDEQTVEYERDAYDKLQKLEFRSLKYAYEIHREGLMETANTPERKYLVDAMEKVLHQDFESIIFDKKLNVDE